MENVRPSALAGALEDLVAAGNDRPLSLKIDRDAEGTPWKAVVKAGLEPVFDLPLEIDPPLPSDTPPSAPNAEVEAVKANVLGWLNLALREAARLNVPGRESMADMAMSEIQAAMSAVRRYVC